MLKILSAERLVNAAYMNMNEMAIRTLFRIPFCENAAAAE